MTLAATAFTLSPHQNTIIPFPGVPPPGRISDPARAKRYERKCDLLSRQSLLDALQRISEIAGDAPLSFLLVHLDRASEEDMDAAHATIQSLVRPVDHVGRFEADQIGIVLQGTGVERAARVATRLEHQLNRSQALKPGCRAVVSAASGTGENALVLPIAADTSFADCG